MAPLTLLQFALKLLVVTLLAFCADGAAGVQAVVVTAGHSTMAEHNQRPAGLLQEPTGCACPVSGCPEEEDPAVDLDRG